MCTFAGHCGLAQGVLSSRGAMANPDPMTLDERARELARTRPKRGLPIAPEAKPGARHLPLADEARDIDRRHRPIYAVWELTLACDLACRHCGSRAGGDRLGGRPPAGGRGP